MIIQTCRREARGGAGRSGSPETKLHTQEFKRAKVGVPYTSPTVGQAWREAWTLDPALLVTPPAGLELGYVPIVTRQARQ